MRVATIYSRGFFGLKASLVGVEVHVLSGLPKFSVVGLAEITVKESKERVKSALLNSGFDFPDRRITVNLAPCDLPKEGGRFDLPIALGILLASGQIKAEGMADYECIGELALSGALRMVSGTFSSWHAAHRSGRALLAPVDAAYVMPDVTGGCCIPVCSLRAAVAHLGGLAPIEPLKLACHEVKPRDDQASLFDDIRGQPMGKRGLLLAASGGHHLLMSGAPGSGKTMLASAFRDLLPPLQDPIKTEVAEIYDVHGGGEARRYSDERPFRRPHHSISSVALVGGGQHPCPGEITKAHGGVLFLDELTEFSASALNQLREPLELGSVSIGRARYRVTWPASFQLIAAMNPCPCGYYGQKNGHCRCHPAAVSRYLSKISGPLLDRIDVHIFMEPVAPALMMDPEPVADDMRVTVLRVQVASVRTKQLARQGCLNAKLSLGRLESLGVSEASRGVLSQALAQRTLSMRGYGRVLALSRTIADLDASDVIEAAHLREALFFKQDLVVMP